ncbi:MAG TPA: hypothetical protein PL009_04835 [Flavipsychrobacter sp.]|nr:hypothetical protein [Flavipsychrobacter sp.]
MPNSKNKTQNNKTTRNEPEITDGPVTPSSMDDSASDEERLKQETSYILLPDVSDIPGQENITSIGPLGEMADVTIASDDEEGIKDGTDLLADEEDDEVEIVMGTEADVTEEDLILLGDKDQDMDMGDDELISKEGLDDTDFDGDPLNEAVADIDSTGDDLDIPDADEENPANSSLGQGDEENNYYSLGSDDNDNLNEGTP